MFFSTNNFHISVCLQPSDNFTVLGNVQLVEDDFNGIVIENAKVLSFGTLSSTVLLSSLQESLHQSEISKDSTTSNLIIELALKKVKYFMLRGLLFCKNRTSIQYKLIDIKPDQ